MSRGLVGVAVLAVATAGARAEGAPWVQLFNGEDLAGWDVVLSGQKPGDDPNRVVQIVDGTIHVYKDAEAPAEQPYGYLRTHNSYSHYRLRFQYRWGDKRYVPRAESLRDAGALYHVTAGTSTHGIWPVCVECQVQEGDTGDLITVDTRCTSFLDPATVDDEYPTFRDPAEGGVERLNDWYINAGRTLDRLEGWNDVEILVCGAEGAVHFVNGAVNQRLARLERQQGSVGSGAWEPLGEGQIALQIEGAEIFYRRIEIRSLSPTEARAALERPEATPLDGDDPRAGNRAATGLAAITVPPGFTVELAADSNLIQHPMMACIDERGRVFLSESDGVNREEMAKLLGERGHRAVMLEDRDGDGVYDNRSTFAEGLVLPNGAQWYDGALYVCSAPYLWRFRDGDGDGRADEADRVVGKFNFDGMSSAFHGPVLGPDGRFYWSGGQHGWRLEAPQRADAPAGAEGPDADLAGPWTTTAPGAFSSWPDGSDAQVLGYGAICNPVETAFTEEGEVLGTAAVYQYVENLRHDAVLHWIEGGVFNLAEKNYVGLTRTGPDLTPVSDRGHVAPSGILRYRSDAFGQEYRDNFFVSEFNTHKVYRLIVERDGSTFRSRDEVFLTSSDQDAHFTDVIEDADGSLLVLDTGGWFRHGCPTSQIAKPTILGAIYRVRKIDAPEVVDPRGAQIRWEAQTPQQLCELVGDGRFVVRDRAVAELARRGEAAILALKRCLAEGSQPRRVQAVWALCRMRSSAANAAVRTALRDGDWHVRLAAAHSASVNRDAAAASDLRELAVSSELPVRREAITALGRLKDKSAAPTLIAAAMLDGDRFGDHAITYALIQIGDHEATAAGLANANPRVQRIALTALDQLNSPLLTREALAGVLDTGDKALAETCFAILLRRPEWAGELTARLKSWFFQPDLGNDEQRQFRGAIRMLHANESVQALVANALESPDLPASSRLCALEAMSLVDAEQLPAAWDEALRRSLDSPDPAIVAQAIATVGERGMRQFGAQLSRLAADATLPPSLRLAAASATITGTASTPAPVFELLIGQCRAASASFDRLAAAQALAKASLSADQLRRVLDAIRGAGPIELPLLLKPFESAAAAGLGAELVDALAAAPGRNVLSSESVAHLLDLFPQDVRRRGMPLVALAESGARDRGVRLAEMVDALGGGDPTRGRDVFFSQRAACAACHRIGQQGAEVGPNLSTIGEIRTHRDLIEAIMFPSASFAREFEPYVVSTTSGKTYTGVVSRKTAQAVYLVGADRAELRIDRSEIDAMEPGAVSIMPQGLDQMLQRSELQDLIAFLQSQK